MRALIKVRDINSSKDINNIRNAITSNEGIIACQISKKKEEIEVIYDQYFLDIDTIIESIENIGYTVLECR
ncbi:heavy-metal-associated domain-containing protein [Hathewaya histolytica]|uniref:Copper chaperone n=1 Tax=Hathewaya histolytica TaxID=1498 RepID=A0A4U9QYB6_HATHI|nr:heavy-metal-associated domain-containing protein [Hathewaya histolytica]VTQ82523.1 copper chaperone [Hathewaya histolytica]